MRGSRRARTEPLHRATKRYLKVLRADLTPAKQRELQKLRPKTRGDCVHGARPCPWVGCRHHLWSDVTAVGNLTINFPDRDPADLEESCSLDVADAGGASYEGVAVLLNVCRERVRQILGGALHKLRREGGLEEYRGHAEPDRRAAYEPDAEREDATARLLRVG